MVPPKAAAGLDTVVVQSQVRAVHGGRKGGEESDLMVRHKELVNGSGFLTISGA